MNLFLRLLKLLGQILAATLILTILVVVQGLLSPGPQSEAHFGPELLKWVVLSNLLTAFTLTIVIAWAARAGWRLVIAVLLLYFGVRYLNPLSEAIFFGLGIPRHVVATEIVGGFFSSLAFAPLAVLIMGRLGSGVGEGNNPAKGWPVGGWLWRVALGVASYFLLYFSAGMLVWPYVKDFYASKSMPAPSSFFLLEVFRALVYIGVAAPVARLMGGRPHRAAASLGLALSIPGGIAPLLLPNPYMPANVRPAHGFEVGISNFIYGALLGFLLTPRLVNPEIDQHPPEPALRAAHE